jgi:hypothetical protein
VDRYPSKVESQTVGRLDYLIRKELGQSARYSQETYNGGGCANHSKNKSSKQDSITVEGDIR